MNKKVIAKNKKARHEYHILDTMEAGLVLQGTEVKAIREGRVTLTEGFAKFIGSELFILNVNIGNYSHTGSYGHDSLRERKLLLKRRELTKLRKNLAGKGHTMIPLSLYFKNGIAKLELAVCKGKQTHDKRYALAERDMKRQIDRMQKIRL